MIVVTAAIVVLVALAAMLVWSRRRVGPAAPTRRTTSSVVAGAVVVEAALLRLAAPAVLRAAGVHRPAQTCGCAADGTARGWVAAGAAVVVPALAVSAITAGRRARRREAGSVSDSQQTPTCEGAAASDGRAEPAG